MFMLSRSFRYISKVNILQKQINLNKVKFSNQLCKRYKTYLPNNEWLSEENGIYKIGIDKEGAEKMGELVYIDYNNNPEDVVSEDEDIVFLESVKAVDSIKAPFDCIILENNEALVDNPSIVNNDSECEENSWIIKFKRHN